MRTLLLKLFILAFLATFGGLQAQDSHAQDPQQKPAQEQTDEQNFFEMTDAAPLSYKGAFVKMMLTLAALIVLIVISVWMLRRVSHGRMKQMNFGRTIKIIERRPLSAKSILYLVEISGKRVVIAESQLEVRTIASDGLLPQDED